MSNRTTAERAAHARSRLETEHNIWISTASTAGLPHLVPLSLAWLDDRIVVATPAETPTARNARDTARARAALENTDDVVLFDADADATPFVDADASLVDRYVSAVGWDPRENPGEWSLLVLTPRSAQAWQGAAEIDGRTIVGEAGLDSVLDSMASYRVVHLVTAATLRAADFDLLPTATRPHYTLVAAGGDTLDAARPLQVLGDAKSNPRHRRRSPRGGDDAHRPRS